MSALQALWTEHRNTEGRTYWYNNTTKASSWEKPDDLKTPFEKALGETKWKEYFSQGRKYWYNTETKESKWVMPPELVEVMEKVEKAAAAPALPPSLPSAPPNFIPATQSGFTPVGSSLVPNLPLNPSLSTPLATTSIPRLPIGSTTSILPARPNLPDDPVVPLAGFATHDEAEKAFMHLLKKAGVDPTWTWDATMRAIIMDPLYKALGTLAEKKAAWQKYNDEIKNKAAEERENRLNRLRPGFKTLLVGNPHITYYSTFRSADALFSQHPTWLAAKIEEERRFLFEEHVNELKRVQLNDERESRNRAIAKLVDLFKQLQVDVVTRWKDAQAAVLESPEYKSDRELQALPALDMLLSFEDYSRVLERDWEESQRKKAIESGRRERKAREGFRELLESLQAEGHIRARTKWKTIYPRVGSDPRYIAMLGNAGSNPLELFWDMVDALDQQFEVKEHVVQKAFEGSDFRFAEGTTYEEFRQALAGAGAGDALSKEDIKQVYDVMKSDIFKKAEDARKKAERRMRHLQDDLRYAMKKLGPVINIDEPFEAAVPHLQELPEFKAIEDEEAQKAAFAKFVKRQKEKLKEMSEDGGSATSRRPRPRDRNDESGRNSSKGDGDVIIPPARSIERDDGPSAARRTSHHHEAASVHSAGDKRGDRDPADRHYRDRERERERERDSRSSRHGRDERERDRSRRVDDYDDRRLNYGYDEKDHRRDRDRDRDRDRRRDHGRDRDDEYERDRDRDRDRKGGGHRDKERRESSRDRDRVRERDGDIVMGERASKKARVETAEAEVTKRGDSPEEGEI